MSTANISTFVCLGKRISTKTLQSSWLRPFNDPALIQGTARAINPLHKATGIGAKVIKVSTETPDCKTFVLQTNQRWPGKRWPGHLAGQHTLFTVRIDGRQLSRTFSISTPSRADGRIAITVKRAHSNGKRISVSKWMLEHLAVGQIVQLSAPAGNFFLQNQASSKLYC